MTTSPAPSSYSAWIPIILDHTLGDNAWLHVRGRVVGGHIGIGVLDKIRNTIQNEEVLSPSSTIGDFFIKLPPDGKADALLIRNASERGTSSQMALEETEILARAHQVKPLASLEEAQLAYSQASIIRKPELTINSAPQRWVFAAMIPVHASVNAHWIVVKIRAHIVSGEVGFSFLRTDGKDVQDEQSYSKSQNPVEVFLPLPRSGGLSKLIIRSTAPDGTVSRAVLDGIETWQLE